MTVPCGLEERGTVVVVEDEEDDVGEKQEQRGTENKGCQPAYLSCQGA